MREIVEKVAASVIPALQNSVEKSRAKETDLRAKYLAAHPGTYTDEQWAEDLFQNDENARCCSELIPVWETFVAVMREQLHTVLEAKGALSPPLSLLEELRDHVNAALQNIYRAHPFAKGVKHISKNWTLAFGFGKRIREEAP